MLRNKISNVILLLACNALHGKGSKATEKRESERDVFLGFSLMAVMTTRCYFSFSILLSKSLTFCKLSQSWIEMGIIFSEIF